MSAKAAGSKAGRRERHLARQAALRERKRLRKARAARFAHLPGQQASHGSDRVPVVRVRKASFSARSIGEMDVPALRDLARSLGCEVRSRHRKADLIVMIQDKYEARS